MLFKDISGNKYGKWKVISYNCIKYGQTKFWNCVCDCGVEKIVNGDSLKKGLSKSCGCSGKDWARKRSVRLDQTTEYYIWAGAKQRCTNPRSTMYKHYGARGIVMCDRWLNSFDNFLADMGKRPEGKSLDRIDNNGPYSPENCQWSTNTEQKRNTRGNTMVSYKGKTQCASAWAEELSIPYKLFVDRLKVGWDIDKIISTPNRKK